MTEKTPPVIALAGRRIDASDAKPARFPLAHADGVRNRIRDKLVMLRTATLVSSAACGADLLALDAATELGVRRVVVLPFDPRRFRERSVTDRPGGAERWGPLFDHVLRGLPAGDLIVLQGHGEGTAAFAAANEAIVRRAVELAEAALAEARAIIVWDGAPRGDDDLTALFAETARREGLAVDEVSTTTQMPSQ